MDIRFFSMDLLKRVGAEEVGRWVGRGRVEGRGVGGNLVSE